MAYQFFLKVFFLLALVVAIAAGFDFAKRFHEPPAEPPPIISLEGLELKFPQVPPPSPSQLSSPESREGKPPPPARPRPVEGLFPSKPPPKPQPTLPQTEIKLPIPELAPIITQPILPPPPLPLPEREFYERFSKSVVQVFCQTRTELFAATGVIVNSNGLILTNAHVAEIMKKVGLENCQARTGSPADKLSDLELVFIADTSPKIFQTDVPQRDFGFLRVTGAVAPFITAEFDAGYRAGKGEWFFTLGYPTEFLQGLTTQASSNLVFSKLTVAGAIDVDGELETAEGYLFKGGIILQQGSSGTALFTPAGKVAALMFATTKGATTAEREGVALSMSYVDRILKLETGQSLAEFIAGH